MSDTLERIRAFVAGLPETAEVLAWGSPTFRVNKKMFAAWSSHEGREAVTIKQTQLDQALLLEDEDGYFLPPYVGKHGWVGVYTDAVDWSLVEGLLEDGYRLTAPKRALKALDS